MIEAGIGGLIQRPGVRQFIKFCIVGSSSFTIDAGVSFFLHYYCLFSVELAKTISFVLAVTNGFIWNRRWTFRAVGLRRKREQYAMFFAVNIVGLVLNVSIVKTVILFETHTWLDQRPTKPVFLAATLVATAIVVFWNFFANKHWTFKRESDGVVE